MNLAGFKVQQQCAVTLWACLHRYMPAERRFKQMRLQEEDVSVGIYARRESEALG